MKFSEKYFHTVVIAVCASFLSSAVFADEDSIYARKVNKATVVDHYTTVTRSIPNTQKTCRDVEVPIYGNKGSGASAGDVLGGMIIGGLIGKGATGKDNGAAAGAVIGGMIAADSKQNKQNVVGYRLETRCHEETVYENRSEEVYSHSVITFYENGKKYKVRFKK